VRRNAERSGLKSRCAQIAEDGPSFELAEIKAMLEKALELDDEYVPALIDLGYFYLRVEDNARSAIPLFQRALGIVKDSAAEIIVGLAECISDTESEEAAKSFSQANEKLELDLLKYEF
jgi:tetratricopeptide (TPR) repeat protein